MWVMEIGISEQYGETLVRRTKAEKVLKTKSLYRASVTENERDPQPGLAKTPLD
jgi:hypothetical protein